MTEVSLTRLYLLRATYLLIAVGLGSDVWPALLRHGPWTMWHGVACSLLGAVSALALVGLRYPLRMLPLLLVELTWKSTWLLIIALPLWRAGVIDAATKETAVACLMGVIFPVIIPWRYVWANYVTAPGDRWRWRARTVASSPAVAGA